MGTGFLSREIKRPGRDDQPFPSNAVVKEGVELDFYSLPRAFTAFYMNKFTCTFAPWYSGVNNKTECDVTKYACVSSHDIKVYIRGCKVQERITVKCVQTLSVISGSKHKENRARYAISLSGVLHRPFNVRTLQREICPFVFCVS
jgi:hypothetical protein